VPTFDVLSLCFSPGTAERKGLLTTTTISRVRSRVSPGPVSKVQSNAGEASSAGETLQIVLSRLEDMKAEDIVTIDLNGKSSIADFMVVATGRSTRHVGAVADNVVSELKKSGLKNIRVEGQPHCEWVLIDIGDVIVHVFRPEVRDFYGLEKMWAPGRAGRKVS
jgi:ribosome-associated protein